MNQQSKAKRAMGIESTFSPLGVLEGVNFFLEGGVGIILPQENHM